MFVDRAYSAINHIEVFCVCCGNRKFYHNFSNEDKDAQWILMVEKRRANIYITSL
jgi:hypothetical protein